MASAAGSSAGSTPGRLVPLASGLTTDAEALPIRAQASVLGADRLAYLVLASGAVEVNGVRANACDGVAISDETELRIVALEDAEIVLVDTKA